MKRLTKKLIKEIGDNLIEVVLEVGTVDCEYRDIFREDFNIEGVGISYECKRKDGSSSQGEIVSSSSEIPFSPFRILGMRRARDSALEAWAYYQSQGINARVVYD